MKNAIKLMAILCLMVATTEFTQAQVIKVVSDKVGIGTSSPSFKLHVNGDVYGNWIRTNGARGLFSQSYGTYFYPISGSYWSMRSDRGLYVRDKGNTVRGRIYHDAANSFGLLDREGNWTVRTALDNYVRFSVNNTIRLSVFNSGHVDVHTARDANGAAGSGSLEVANALRLDNNEIITNTNASLYLQHDNNGDLWVDGGSFQVDASANTVGFYKAFDRNNTAYYLDPSSISRMNWVLPSSDNVGYCGSSASTWGYGYFYRLYRTFEYTLSDARVKENVRPIQNALDKVMLLDGKLYDFKAGAATNFAGPKTALNNFENTTVQSTTIGALKSESASQTVAPITAERLDANGEIGEDVPESILPDNSMASADETFGPIPQMEMSARDSEEFSQSTEAENRMRKDNYGFIAQEVNQVLPEVVDYDAENDVYSMSYTAIIPLLVESIKEQQQMIESQQAQIDALKLMLEQE